jgi:hypothetical protein
VLEAVTPAALEVAFEVSDELRRRKVEVDRLRQAQVERAREDAELAQRQFMLVRPEHRLVADTLEQQWNENLARLAALEEDYARATTTDGPGLSGHDREPIQALVADLPRVWHEGIGDRKGHTQTLAPPPRWSRRHSVSPTGYR